MPATVATVRKIALGLPEVTEALCFGTPAFYVRKKLMLRMWEDGETLVCKLLMEGREQLVDAAPDVFSYTDHYRNYPCVLINLNAVKESVLREMIDGAWRVVAPPQLLAVRPTSR